MNTAIATSCETRKGGSDPVGAIAFSAGTFRKSCATRTKTLRYNAIPPCTSHLTPVARENRDRQDDQRYRADSLGRQKLVEWKKEPGQACQYCSDEKKRGPAVEPIRGEQSIDNHESRKDPDEAQHHVHESECRHAEDHEVCACRPRLRPGRCGENYHMPVNRPVQGNVCRPNREWRRSI